MTYTILKAAQSDANLVTVVEFAYDDGQKVTAEIQHFMPTSKADVELGISNRAASERTKLDFAAGAAKEILGQLEIGKAIELK